MGSRAGDVEMGCQLTGRDGETHGTAFFDVGEGIGLPIGEAFLCIGASFGSHDGGSIAVADPAVVRAL